MTIYEEIQKEVEELSTQYADEETIRVSSLQDWVTYALPSLAKAGLCASKKHFRKEMIRLAAMAVLAIQAADKKG
jgi:hypothetical protein